MGITWNKHARPKGKKGEGVLEGQLEDYEVENILSTKLVYNILQSHYKYNCFNTINPYFVLFI